MHYHRLHNYTCLKYLTMLAPALTSYKLLQNRIKVSYELHLKRIQLDCACVSLLFIVVAVHDGSRAGVSSGQTFAVFMYIWNGLWKSGEKSNALPKTKKDFAFEFGFNWISFGRFRLDSICICAQIWKVILTFRHSKRCTLANNILIWIDRHQEALVLRTIQKIVTTLRSNSHNIRHTWRHKVNFSNSCKWSKLFKFNF